MTLIRATTTAIYRERLARVILGETLDLKPATARLGTGRYDAATGTVTPPQPGDTGLMHPVLSSFTLQIDRQDSEIRFSMSVPGTADPLSITEAGVFLADGTAVILESFRPITLQPGLVFEFVQTLFPEV